MRRFGRFLLVLLIVAAAAVGYMSIREESGLFGGRGSLALALGSSSDAVSPSFAAAQGVSGLPDVDIDSWNLRLVNADNAVEPDFYVPTTVTADGYLFDERAAGALDAMLKAGRDEGMRLALTSAYRTYDYQSMLFGSKIDSIQSESGLSRLEAEAEASSVVARPGTSEHNIGLAADIVCEYYSILDEGYADTPEANWLKEHCAEYGFILRYTEEKRHITGIISEPWHFRYVGVEAAGYIMDNGLCLEEFIGLY